MRCSELVKHHHYLNGKTFDKREGKPYRDSSLQNWRLQSAHTNHSIAGTKQLRYLEVISERDTIRGDSIENRGYLFIYMWGCTYVICTLTFAYFCVCLVVYPIPNFTKQNLPVYQSLPI